MSLTKRILWGVKMGEQQFLSARFAKKSRNGVSLNLDFDLDDGRMIRVKKVDEHRGRFYATLVHKKGDPPRAIFKVGDIVYTKMTEHGRQMCLLVLKRQGKKWLIKIVA